MGKILLTSFYSRQLYFMIYRSKTGSLQLDQEVDYFKNKLQGDT